jgi:hypothetical protein
MIVVTKKIKGLIDRNLNGVAVYIAISVLQLPLAHYFPVRKMFRVFYFKDYSNEQKWV